jgi:hypothetical protein
MLSSRASWLAPGVTLALLLGAGSSAASALEDLPVGDPIEAELRVLDLYPSSTLAERIRLAHLGTRPLTRAALQGTGAAVAPASATASIALARLERVLGRDPVESFVPNESFLPTPRLFSHFEPPAERLEVSVALEGALVADRDRTETTSGSGGHVRAALQLDRLLAFTNVVLGRFDNARAFADPIVTNTDVTTLTEETYLAYASGSGAWGAHFGRSRWHWGPGDEGSLILSKTSAPLTALEFHADLPSLRLHASALSATLARSAGEQFAAHRLEWQPFDALRIGATEAARYQSSGWSPLYVVGLIPYVLVQRLENQDEPSGAGTLHNNILLGTDISWRVADGTRIYGEIAIDDLHARTSENPDKIAWQVGWDGAGMIGKSRLTWNGEYTRVWRYVYTSYFGRAFEAQGMPLGFPTGPDSRRVRVRGTWDPSVAWQLFARAAQTDRGENSLDEPYVPGAPRFSGADFEGVVERTREADLGLRWWPAGGVDIALSGGWFRIENRDHLAGAKHESPRATLELRLVR